MNLTAIIRLKEQLAISNEFTPKQRDFALEAINAAIHSAHLEKLVREWRDAQKTIDRLTVQERQQDRAPLDRLIAAHNALIKYADEEMG